MYSPANLSVSCHVVNFPRTRTYIHSHTQGEYKAQKEAVWAVTNMAAGGNTEQIAYIVQAGCLKPLCDLLVVKETKIVSVILEAITNILHVS